MKGSLIVLVCAACVSAAVCTRSAEASAVWQLSFAEINIQAEAQPPVTPEPDAPEAESCPCVCPVSYVRETTVSPLPRCEYRRPRWGGSMDVQRDNPDMSHSWGY